MKTNPMTSRELAHHIRTKVKLLSAPLDNGTALSEYERSVLHSIMTRAYGLASVVESRKSER